MAVKIPTSGGHAPCNLVPLSVAVDCDYDGTISFMRKSCCMAQQILK